MRNDRKQTILFIIILLVLSMGIGYAFLTTTLNIDGISDIDSAVWDIHFENVSDSISSSFSSVSGEIISPATIGNNGTTINFHVKLDYGDFYSLAFIATNDGTLDAVIDNISITVDGVEQELPSYLKQTFTYYDGPEVETGTYLPAGVSDAYFYELYYKANITASELPTENESISISINITYTQTKKPFYNNTYVYSSYNGEAFINESLFHYCRYYDNYLDAMNRFGHHTFLRHYMVNNLVSTSEVGFEIGGNTYYVKGGDSGAAYESNKVIAQQAFGSSNCYAIDSGYSCDLDDYSLTLKTDGNVSFSDGYNYGCEIFYTGMSDCYIIT